MGEDAGAIDFRHEPKGITIEPGAVESTIDLAGHAAPKPIHYIVDGLSAAA